MKCLALSLLVFVASCESKTKTDPEAKSADVAKAEAEAAKVETPAPEALDTPMARDIDRICNAEELSGALDLQPGERAMHAGIWLAENLESQEARNLSAALTKLSPDERIARLQNEVEANRIPSCEILHAWRGGKPE